MKSRIHCNDPLPRTETHPIGPATNRRGCVLSFANVWVSNARPADEQLRAVVDPHPPQRFRVNGTLANLPELQAAFSVPDGSPMVNVPRCEIW